MQTICVYFIDTASRLSVQTSTYIDSKRLSFSIVSIQSKDYDFKIVTAIMKFQIEKKKNKRTRVERKKMLIKKMKEIKTS